MIALLLKLLVGEPPDSISKARLREVLERERMDAWDSPRPWVKPQRRVASTLWHRRRHLWLVA